MRHTSNSNFVYVMSDGENHKIGISKDPQARVVSLTKQLKKKISILLSINCVDARGCEIELHRRFKEFNVDKEWFNFPDKSFLAEVWEVCTNNLVSDDYFYAEGYLASQEAPEVQEVVDNHLVLTYVYVNEQTDGKYNRGTTVLPMIMRRMGCVKIPVTWHSTNIYITPAGIEQGLHKLPKKDLKQYLNAPIS